MTLVRRLFRFSTSSLAIGVFLAIVNSSFTASMVEADEASREAAYRNQLLPLLRTYCFDCHGADEGEGDVMLGKYENVNQLASDRKEWMRALKQVKVG